MSIWKLTLPLLCLAGGTLTGWPAATLQSTANAATQAAPETYAPPTRRRVPLARDTSTFREDVALTNACVESGQNKADCLCVTYVLKYELSLPDYRAASQMLFTPANADAAAQRAANLSARNIPARITRYRNLNRELISQSDFAPRCTEADHYFKGEQNPQ